MKRPAAAQSAFTLIEMLVVLALGAILATIVTVSLTGSVRAARAGDAAGRIATYDRLAREHARRFGRTSQLVFDLDRGTVIHVAAEKDADPRAYAGGALHLPSGIRLACVVTAGGSTRNARVAISCSSDGQTPSYAVGLADARGEQYWIVVAGLTGQATKVGSEQEVQDIFLAMRGSATALSGGDDAR